MFEKNFLKKMNFLIKILMMLSILLMRGLSSFGLDMLRVFRRFFSKGHKDVEVQTNPIELFRLPHEIWNNPGSDCVHVEGCQHIGVGGKRLSMCTQCMRGF